MNDDNTDLVIGRSTSGAEALKKKIPKAHVVAASNTVPSEVLVGVHEARRKAKRPSMVYCGDERTSKDLAASLIRDAGFDPLDAGPLRIARYVEPFALLVGQPAYGGAGGPELAYRFERFGDEPQRSWMAAFVDGQEIQRNQLQVIAGRRDRAGGETGWWRATAGPFWSGAPPCWAA